MLFSRINSIHETRSYAVETRVNELKEAVAALESLRGTADTEEGEKELDALIGDAKNALSKADWQLYITKEHYEISYVKSLRKELGL